MKKLSYIFFIIIMFFTCLIVKAADKTLTFNSVKDTSYQIDYLYNDNNNYFVVSNKIVYSYSGDKLIAEKEFSDLSHMKIIAYNKQYLLIGLDNMTLKVYYLDSYLHVLETKEFSGSSLTDFSVYINHGKVYLLDLVDGNLNGTNIYEIDEELKIEENSFSSYDSDKLKDIFKSDYYLIHQTGLENHYYLKSSYTEERNVLVGYKLNSDNTKSSLISFFDANGKLIKEIGQNGVEEFTDGEIVNNKIVALANDGMYLYDLNGDYIDKIAIDKGIGINKFYRIKDNLLLVQDKKVRIYKYKCYINVLDEQYGSVIVKESALPNEDVELNIKPNSGYKVDKIIVKDSKGNVIDTTNRTFTMPDYDVNIIVEYTNTVVNPETLDIITIVLGGFVVIGMITIYLYRKYKWLR